MVEFSPDVPFATRLELVRPSLLPSEATVADFMLRRAYFVVESKAQDVAETVGVARSTVIRTSQSLGYTGYTQCRVALARELAPKEEEIAYGDDLLGRVRARADELGRSSATIVSALTQEVLATVVASLASAPRILCAANGFSAAVALDLSLRLAAMGLPSEFVSDFVAQQFTAAHLREGDCCVVVSASGQNRSTLRIAEIAREAGTTVIAICSFPNAPLTMIADHTLLAIPPQSSFRNELEQTSRVAHVVVAEALAALVIEHLGSDEVRARRNRLIPVIGSNLVE